MIIIIKTKITNQNHSKMNKNLFLIKIKLNLFLIIINNYLGSTPMSISHALILDCKEIVSFCNLILSSFKAFV